MMTRTMIGLIMGLVIGCGGGGSGNGDVDSGPGGNPDAARPDPAVCEQGGTATSDRYLPAAIGNLWRYQVTDPTGVNPPATKRQEFTEEFVPEGETEPVIVQVTTKAEGRTETWMRYVGDKLVRLRQQDFTPDGLLERTTVYQPYRLRMDETAANLAVNSVWEDTYTNVIYDPVGTELSRVDVVDVWTVVADGVACTTPWGELSCLQVHRERTVGGTAVKDFYFARGYGKVHETGGQTEDLIGCSLY